MAAVEAKQAQERALAEARELRASGVGGPCPCCGKTQDTKPNGDGYAGGTHTAAEEAAWSGMVVCCLHCEMPLGRAMGFLSCPEHGWECSSASLFNDERKRISIAEEGSR
jgi:hypothetical protein